MPKKSSDIGSPTYDRGGFLSIDDIFDRVTEIFPDDASDVIKDLKCGGKDIIDKHAYKASYDLHLGSEIVKSTSSKPIMLSDKNKFVEIKPGEFALLNTYEKVCIPQDLMALISLRNSKKSKGLLNISGFHVDPGYEGHLTFSVYNAGSKSLWLKYEEPIFMIFFATLVHPTKKGYGIGRGSSFLPKDIEGIRGPPLTLINLNYRLQKAEGMIKLLLGLLIATLGSVIIAIIPK